MSLRSRHWMKFSVYFRWGIRGNSPQGVSRPSTQHLTSNTSSNSSRVWEEDGHALLLPAVQNLKIADVALGQIGLCALCPVLFTPLSYSPAGGQYKHAGCQNGHHPFLSLCFVQLSPTPPPVSISRRSSFQKFRHVSHSYFVFTRRIKLCLILQKRAQ